MPGDAAIFLLFLLVALAMRAVVLGNPVVHSDEQFYRLVGERMLAGDLPYVAVWDRKPIGLFLIHAAFAPAGWPASVVLLQLAAGIVAAFTAFLVHRLALAHARPSGALVAGLGYLLFLPVFNGLAGQSPVYYNALMALAGLAMVALVACPRPGGALVAAGAGVMGLVGLAIQIKYTVVFEGLFFGLALLWSGWRAGWRVPGLAAAAALWAGIALLPTLAALGAFALAGESDAFVQANFLSIFGRQEAFWLSFLRLLAAAALLIPFWLALLRAPAAPVPDAMAARARRFIGLWAIAAVAGYLVFGSWYDHYALPLLVPLAALAAAGLAWEPQTRRYAIGLIVTGLAAGTAMTVVNRLEQGSGRQLAAMAQVVSANLGDGCLHVFDGPTALYSATGACTATRFVFPSHLNNRKEAGALGRDVAAETRAMLARRPAVLVLGQKPRRTANLATDRIVRAAAVRDYRLVATLPLGARRFLIYARTVRTAP